MINLVLCMRNMQGLGRYFLLGNEHKKALYPWIESFCVMDCYIVLSCRFLYNLLNMW